MYQETSFEKITPENMFDSGDLNILICYLLSVINEGVPATEMAQLFHYEGISNYFDVQTAISKLEQDDFIAPLNNIKELYVITEKGRSLSNTLKESISLTLRSKVYNAVVKMLKRYKTEKSTDIEITKKENGALLSYNIKNDEDVLFSFSIMLPNESQAAALKNQILNDPKYYYDSFIQLLTEDIPQKNNSQE